MEEHVGQDLSLHVERAGRNIVLRISGAAGLGDAEAMARSLGRFADRPKTILVLDLSDLWFINAEGLDALVAQQAASRLQHGQVRLVNPSQEVRHLLELTRLTEYLPIYGTIEDATAEA